MRFGACWQWLSVIVVGDATAAAEASEGSVHVTMEFEVILRCEDLIAVGETLYDEEEKELFKMRGRENSFKIGCFARSMRDIVASLLNQ